MIEFWQDSSDKSCRSTALCAYPKRMHSKLLFVLNISVRKVLLYQGDEVTSNVSWTFVKKRTNITPDIWSKWSESMSSAWNTCMYLDAQDFNSSIPSRPPFTQTDPKVCLDVTRFRTFCQSLAHNQSIYMQTPKKLYSYF